MKCAAWQVATVLMISVCLASMAVAQQQPPQRPSEAVATVAGETITDRDIVNYAYRYPQLMSELRTPGGPLRVLNYMIGDELMLLEGQRQGIPLPEGGDRQAHLAMLEKRFIEPCAPPTEAQIKAYYDANPAQFSSPLRLRLERIGLDTSEQQLAEHTEKLLAIKQQIESGERDFAETADQLSEDIIGRGRGGDIGFVSIDLSANPAFESFVQAEPDTILGPVQEPGKLYLYRVKGRQDPILDDFETVQRDAARGVAQNCRQRAAAAVVAQLKQRWPVEILVDDISITPERR